MSKIEKLNPELFIYELYEADFWGALDLDFSESMDTQVFTKRLAEYIIGYCDAGRLSVRPWAGKYAVMCEKDGEKFWFHLDKYEFENLNRFLDGKPLNDF